MAEDDTLLSMANPSDSVRCVECGHEYDLPALGEEMGCPECGAISWVSTRIPAAAPADPLPRYDAQKG
jgi:predicted  nucleic acid-binding Zn-ribbon protein